ARRDPGQRSEEGRRPRRRTGGRDSRRQTDGRSDPALSSHSTHGPTDRTDARREPAGHYRRGDGESNLEDRRRDGGAHRRNGQPPHSLRHGEEHGPRNGARRYIAVTKIGWQDRQLVKGLMAPSLPLIVVA